MSPNERVRCEWASGDPLLVRYHDEEWGVPLHDDRALFEFLILEGAQAGLSWLTVLRKRENYRRLLDHFDPEKIARYDAGDERRLLSNDGIIRNRLKISAAVQNAKAVLAIRREFGSLDAYIWGFVANQPRKNSWKHLREIPAETGESRAMSKDLLKRGFRFVGPTICYAFMQAVGLVNDHTIHCYRHDEI